MNAKKKLLSGLLTAGLLLNAEAESRTGCDLQKAV